MSEKGERKQKTQTGHEIPVPKRGDFFDNLKKVAEKKSPKKSRRGKRRKKQ